MRICNLILPISFALCFTFNSAQAQSGQAKKGTDTPSRIGFGANVGNIAFGNHTFQFGIAPNIAFKASEALAFGFMVKLDYYYIKDTYYDAKYSAFDVGPTVFGRWKPLWAIDNATPFLKGLFIQAEYERASIARPFDEFGNLNIVGDKIIGFRKWEDYLYVGLGAASGYPFSTFISIHYNVLDDFEHSRQPFSYRLGFTYNY